MPDETTILSLPLILPAQAQKHVTHNEALAALDVIVQLAVQSRTLTVPPGSPAEGERHIVAAGASGDWAGQAGKVAVLAQGLWQFHAPKPGWQAFVEAEGQVVAFAGGVWAGLSDQPLSVPQLGVSATADATNRLTVSAPATLLNHAGAGHQLKLNKAAAAETASLLFQTGFSGRAEMGTAGSDDFAVKVSADGSAFATALQAEAATGRVTLPQPLLLGAQAGDPASPADGMVWMNGGTGEVKVQSGGATVVLSPPAGVSDGDKGDITVSGTGAVWTIDAGVVALDRLADLAQGRLIGRVSAGSGTPEALEVAEVQDMLGVAPASLADWWENTRFTTTTAAIGAVAGVAISGGSNTTAIPSATLQGHNPYGVFLRSGTTANGGYRYLTSSLVADHFGVVARKYRARLLWRNFAGVTVRIGHLDTANSSDATDGAYFEVLADQISAKTAYNATRTTHATTYTATVDTVYTLDIEVTAAADAVRFRVFEGLDETAVMDVTITTNIPDAPARSFGAGLVATDSGTTASDMVILYEMGFGTLGGFRRAFG